MVPSRNFSAPVPSVYQQAGSVSRLLRDESRGKILRTVWQDLLYGFRMLLKKPGFTIVAALSLGLGIGANATIFSIINATLLSDLPYPDANRLMVLWTAPLNRPGIRNNVTAR